MAESNRGSSSGGSSSKSSRKSGGSSKSRKSGGSSKSGGSNNRSPRDVVREAVGQVQELIGRPVESVTGMEKDGREWKVTLEVLELERVPNTTDVLGKYEVTLDKDGEITSARRTRRYHRAEAGED
jgi:hypothetical protein